MKYITITLVFMFLASPFQLLSQDTSKRLSYFAPSICFIAHYPSKISLPDSLRKSVYEFFMVDMLCYFDSLGNFLEFLPIELDMQRYSGEVDGRFYFNPATRQYSTGFKEDEALKYTKWAELQLRPLIKVERYAYKLLCKEPITNKNSLPLEVRLE